MSCLYCDVYHNLQSSSDDRAPLPHPGQGQGGSGASAQPGGSPQGLVQGTSDIDVPPAGTLQSALQQLDRLAMGDWDEADQAAFMRVVSRAPPGSRFVVIESREWPSGSRFGAPGQPARGLMCFALYDKVLWGERYLTDVGSCAVFWLNGSGWPMGELKGQGQTAAAASPRWIEAVGRGHWSDWETAQRRCIGFFTAEVQRHSCCLEKPTAAQNLKVHCNKVLQGLT